MSLKLTLDYAAQIVKEPGFGQRISSSEWAAKLNPTTGTLKGIWRDQWTQTLMLQPMQLQKGWKDTSDQLDSIVGLTDRGSGKLVTNATNITNFAVFEANLKQNANNPWVFFSPIPGTTLSFAQLVVQLAIIALESKSPAPISTSDTRVIAYTEEKPSGNQAWYFRWFQPDAQIGPSFMGLSIGEFNLVFMEEVLAIFRDTSTAGDRSSFERVMMIPLFSPGSNDQSANAGYANAFGASETGPGERSILWLPFHRSLVYIEASSGKWAILDTRQAPVLNGKTGDDRDWDIVKDDREVLVWGLTPSVGRFQLQKVKWFDTATVRLPTFTLDYAPAAALTADNIVPDADALHGTLLSWGSPTTPPGYDNIANSLDTCPPVTTGATDQTRTYGESFTFTASGSRRFTPFLYGVDIRVPRDVRTWPVSATTIADAHPDAGLVRRATIRASVENPEDTSLTVEAIDRPPYAFPALWYRSAYPVRLWDDAGTVGTGDDTNLFIGLTAPTAVQPLRLDTNILRDVRVSAGSYWKRLATTQLRDQRDWTGTGHITAVDFVVRQCGIDTTGADYPTPQSDWNVPLGGATNTRFPNTGALRPHWQPKPGEFADKFISRIAQEFAGFVVGFYPDGTFYYLPAANGWFYNTSGVTFFKNRASGSPCYESPVEFENVEPEANAVQVVARSQTGGLLRSSVFVDWASIQNTAAPNFLGEWRSKVYQIDGVLTCAEVNRVAFIIFQQLRRRHLKVRFKGDYVPALKPGRVFTLEGQGSDTYRLMDYTAELERTGWHPVSYQAELVENGYL